MSEIKFKTQSARFKLHKLQEDVEETTYVDESTLNRYNISTDYWIKKRRLNQEIIDLFQLGYDPITDAVTIPVRDSSGRLYGVTRRFLSDEYAGARYKYPKKFQASQNVFASWLNADYDMSTVSIHEGAIDAMKLWQTGIPAIALYGSSISEHHIKIMLQIGVSNVVYFGDSDVAGQRAKQRAKGWWAKPDGTYRYKPQTDLTKHFIMKHVTDYNGKKDAGEMTTKEIENSWDSAKLYTFNPYSKRKVYA